MNVFAELALVTVVYWIGGWDNLTQTIGGFIAGV